MTSGDAIRMTPKRCDLGVQDALGKWRYRGEAYAMQNNRYSIRDKSLHRGFCASGTRIQARIL